MSALIAQSVTVRYPGRDVPALHSVSLSIEQQDFAVALGPSGCGKTTLLNVLAGFVHPTSGEARFNGQVIKGPGVERAVVFQQGTLLPWLTVIDNIAFGPKLQGVSKVERQAAAAKWLELVGLSGTGQHRTWELSGGMRQRVGIARALASNSKALLMDEPFGALDAFAREQMQELLIDVWQKSQRRVFLITHDIEEALFLATHLVLMSPSPGRIVEAHSPPFNQRYRNGEPARSIKSDPKFIELREHLRETLMRSGLERKALSA